MTFAYQQTLELPASSSIAHLLKLQGERSPDGTALAAPERNPLSFCSLFVHTDGTVQRLNALGIGRNDRIAAVLPNGPEAALAFLAISSGASFAPLNPAYCAPELDFYLRDLKPKALVVQSGMDSPALAVCERQSIPIIELSPAGQAESGTFSLKGKAEPASAQGGFASPEDIALILYTSGTTSRPKMVPLTHTNLLASAQNIAASLRLTESDRCLNVMPLFHIHGLIGAVLSSLMAGSGVFCAPGFEVEKFFSWLEKFRPSWYTAVPTIHQAILSGAPGHSKELRRSSLRFIRSCSAALPLRLMQGLEEVFHVPVIEAYGMTEASHQIASNPLPPGTRKARSVGLPVGAEVAVLDEQGDFAERGKTGEIVIRGANVMQGYAGGDDANLESFKDGWFKTGDQGYFDKEGYIFITGRLKEVINRGGEKISLVEIDEALKKHPFVSNAVAFAVPHPTLGQDLAAAIVVTDRTEVTERLIREYLGGRLAEFKIPSRVWIVDEMPQGVTGKIQRAALAEKFANKINGNSGAPKTILETVVASIYAEVLGAQQIGANDNFFALGGDSLRATQVISRVRAMFQVNLSIAALFRKPTPAEIAEEITRRAETIDQELAEKFLKELPDLSEQDPQRVGAKPSRNQF